MVRASAIASAAVIALVAMLLALRGGTSSDPAEPSAIPAASGERWIAAGLLVLGFLAVALLVAGVVHVARSRRRRR